MTLTRHKLLFIMIFLFSIVVLFSSLFDIVYEKQWLQIILTLYAILIIFTIVLLFLKPTKKIVESGDIVEEFEKTLEGRFLIVELSERYLPLLQW